MVAQFEPRDAMGMERKKKRNFVGFKKRSFQLALQGVYESFVFAKENENIGIKIEIIQ